MCCSIATNWILIPNGLSTPGITGISMTLEHFTGINYALIYYAITILILILTYFTLGKKDASNIVILSILYPMVLWVLSFVDVQIIFEDKLVAIAAFGVVYGTGIGIPYRPDQEANDIYEIADGVKHAYEEILIPAGMGDVAIYTELGRFMMGPYGHLVTKVIHEKHTHKEYLGCDACAVNLMRPAMYGAYHHITVLGKENEPCDHKYDVTGSLCENNDKFAIDRMLPEVEVGDYLAIHDTGAHGFSMGYNYNGKLRSAELLLKENGEVQLIRRAETPKDYFATFDCFDIYNKFDWNA
jgi:hypothetical protein